MKFTKYMLAAAMGTLMVSGAAKAEVKIGVNTDMSSLQSVWLGQGSVTAAKLAVEDFGGEVLGQPVEIVVGDNQAKADLEVSIARRWFESEGVDAIVDINLSSAAIQINHLAERFNKVALPSASGTTRLVGEDCTPNNVSYGWNTHAFSTLAPIALLKQGKKKWFFITVDYTFGHDMQAAAEAVIREKGGEVVGSVLHPIGATDYSALLLQAQASGADVIGVVNSGQDTVSTIKQAAEFGIMAGGQTLVPFIFTIIDVDSLGLDVTEGLVAGLAFYWDQDDRTRDWSARFEEIQGRKPTYFQAAVYSSTLTYLKGVEAAGTTDGDKVVEAMKNLETIDDMFARGAKIREDGTLIHDLYLGKVKSKAESTGRWDYFEIVDTLPGDVVYQPMDRTACKLFQ